MHEGGADLLVVDEFRFFLGFDLDEEGVGDDGVDGW